MRCLWGLRVCSRRYFEGSRSGGPVYHFQREDMCGVLDAVLAFDFGVGGW